jgi:hypothetical protein
MVLLIPEKSGKACSALPDAVFGKEVMVVVDSKDRYGHSLGWGTTMIKTSTKNSLRQD